jgi:hypothetical protein
MQPELQQTLANKYQWDTDEVILGLPPHVKDVPGDEEFSLTKIIVFNLVLLKTFIGLLIAQFIHLFPFLFRQYKNGELVFKGTADLGLLTIFSKFNDWEVFDNFNCFFKPWTFLKKPEVAKDWQEDREFGRQRLAGINPVLIRKCKPEDIDLNGDFPVTDELVKPVLGDVTLNSALADDRLYLLDYKLLDGIITPEVEDELGRYPSAPLCLLYVDAQKQLVPIAIQLQQKQTSCDHPIFTPSSPPEDWLTAKTAVACSDIAYQGVIPHLLYTHLVIEPFIVSTFRQLSPQHIIFQILKPHFFNTLAINDMARHLFLGRQRFFDSTGVLGYVGSNEILSRGYRGEGREYKDIPWQFYQTALPYDLATRDVKDLPGYYYRDDALLMWNAIKEYVTNVLRLYYKGSDDLVNDQELQSWKNELIDSNYGNVQGLLAPEKSEQLTGKISNLDDLIEIVTNIIFTATVQHSALNFGQYDYAAWIPNMQFALYQDFSNPIKSHKLIERLPNRWQSIKQIILVSVLSITPPYTSRSLVTMKNPFNDKQAREAFNNFQKVRLQEIENKISDRNKKLNKPYTYLMPSKIAQSIAI